MGIVSSPTFEDALEIGGRCAGKGRWTLGFGHGATEGWGYGCALGISARVYKGGGHPGVQGSGDGPVRLLGR